MDEDFSFGYWVRRRRKALDLTQAGLGQRVGASAAMIRKIEADERRPSRELAVLLAAALAVPEAESARFQQAARDVTPVDQLSPPAAPPSLPGLPPTNLPAPVTSMVNRHSDLQRVAALLLSADVRLVTLVGPPGMGKTRLSIQAAARVRPRFRDGVWFVDLSAVSDGEQVLPRVALTLGLVAPGLTPTDQLRIEFRDKQVLLLLDNLEQVVEPAAMAIASLLRACPGLKVLATSRIRLDVYGEHEYLLPPMSLPPIDETTDRLLRYEAVQLFVDRVRQHRLEFALTESVAAPVVEICRRMEGLPLALELAAARTRLMDVVELAAALRDEYGRDWHALLQVSTRDLPARQQTLYHAVAWSYGLLQAEERAVLRRLGVFAGPFDLPAAVAVAGAPDGAADVAPIMKRLVDHSLVSCESQRPERWRLLEMIREFAVAEMSAAEHQAAKLSHARHFACRQRAWRDAWLDRAYLDAVEDDLDNYRAALRYVLESGDAALAHELGAVMGRFWERRGLLHEGRAMLASIIAMPGDADPQARFAVLHEATILAWMQQDFAVAEALADRGMSWARTREMPAAVMVMLNMLGRIFLEQARYAEADEILAEAIELGQSLLPPDPGSMPYLQRGEVALALGQLEQAEALTCHALATVTERDLVPYCLGWNNLAEVALARGDIRAAREALRRVLPVAHLHARRTRVFLNATAGLLLAEPAAPAAAARLLACVTAANARLGDPLSPLTQGQIAVRLAAARERLAARAWHEALSAGERLSLDQALAEARQALGSDASAG